MSPSLGNMLVRLGVVTTEKFRRKSLSASPSSSNSSPPASSSSSSNDHSTRGTSNATGEEGNTRRHISTVLSSTTTPIAAAYSTTTTASSLADAIAEVEAEWQMVSPSMSASEVEVPAGVPPPITPIKSVAQPSAKQFTAKRARESTSPYQAGNTSIGSSSSLRYFKKAKTADEHLSNLLYVKHEAVRLESTIQVVHNLKDANVVAAATPTYNTWKDNLSDFGDLLDVAIELADEYTASTLSKAALALIEELAPYKSKRLDPSRRKDAIHIRYLAEGTASSAEGLAQAILATFPDARDARGRKIEDRLTILRTATEMETVLDAIYEGEHTSNRPIIPRYSK